MVCISAQAGSNPPAPQPKVPTPPGASIDANLFVLIFLGVLFAFIFLKKYSNTNNQA